MDARWALPVGFLVVLSRCLGQGEPAADAALDDTVASNPLAGLLDGVPCEASTVGEGATSENLLRVGGLESEKGDHAELDVKGNLAAHSTHGAKGFELLDLTNRTAPVLLSTFTGDRGSSYDVKLHPDLTTVFQGLAVGVEMVDIRDRAAPVKTGEWLFEDGVVLPPPVAGRPTNAHMLYAYAIENQTWLFVAPEDNFGVRILKVTGEPGSYGLEQVARAGEYLNGVLGPHDLWATYDDVLKTHVLYIANGFHGWLAYDIADPARPSFLGGMVNADTHQGYVHTIQAQWIDGRRIVATISEVGVNAMRVFDASDFRLPKFLGSWQSSNPANFQHNLQFVDGTLVFSHYAQGVFLFDLTNVGSQAYGQTLQLRPVGHYAVDGSSWDVGVKDGLLYVGDAAGLHVVGYGCWTPGLAGLTSTG